MKVYLSGPVSLGGTLSESDVRSNVERFRTVRERMAAEGHEVLDPTTINGGAEWTWQDWMRRALAMLLEAERVHVLPGWEQSPGSRVELAVAHNIGLPVTVEP